MAVLNQYNYPDETGHLGLDVHHSQYSLSREISSWSVVKATIVKDLQILRRYKANLIGNLVRTVLFVAVFYFFSVAISFDDLLDNSINAMFIFYLAGFTLMWFDSVALWKPLETVTTDLTNGTLESIYAGPSSRYAYFIGTILAEGIISTIMFIPIFSALIIVAGADLMTVGQFLIVIVVFVATLASFGIIIALSAVLWKQTSSIANLLGTMFTFISGGLFPVQSFPTALRYFAYIFPYTWGFDLMRYYAFGGNWETLLPVWMEWLVLIAMTIGFFLLSKKMIGTVEHHAKHKGLHLL
ncbi:MAG: ABC transporter permease [Candidatus Heimdallarchaeota archaeon]|nr:ABC transporter permease [Candidatus Heimdallarchaeota archaeon]